MYKYTQLPYTPVLGEKVVNLNGCYYKVVEVLPENKILFETESKSRLIGVGTKLFKRTEKETGKSFIGIQWDYSKEVPG